MPISLKDLQREQGEWTKKNFPNQTGLEAVLGVCEESGEMAHCALKMAQGIRGTKEQHMTAMEDAVGDVVIFLCAVCNQYGLNLEECVDVAWENIVKKRDWVAFPQEGRMRQGFDPPVAKASGVNPQLFNHEDLSADPPASTFIAVRGAQRPELFDPDEELEDYND